MDFPPEPQNRSVVSEKFAVEPVQFQFAISAIVALAVANNTLCLGLKSGRIIRIDLDNPESVDDVDVKEGGCEIENLFLDPTGSYLLITTSSRDNYVLNYQTTKVKNLGRLRDLAVTSVAWSPIESSLSSGEVLLGTADGCIYETCLEFSDEYFKREDRYVRKVAEFKVEDSHVVTPITGITVQLGASPSYRKIVVVNANGHAWYYSGKISAHLQDGIPVYTKFFEREEHVSQEFGADDGRAALLAVTPPEPKSSSWAFALLTGVGIVHRTIRKDHSDTLESRKTFFQGSNIYILNQIQSTSPIVGMCLTSFHIAIATESKLFVINRFSYELVFEQNVTQPREKLLGLVVDPKQHTFWLFSAENIYEITVDDESRGMWKLVLEQGDLDEAMRLSESDPDPTSQDELLGILGDRQLKEKDYLGAANTYGNSRRRPLEQTALLFLDANQPEALLKYLQTKLGSFPKANVTQRLLVASWIIELLMEQFNKLDDQEATSESPLEEQRRVLSTKFHDFITKYKSDLHKGTVFEIMSVNGRQEELLYYAAAIQDYNFVLHYWVGLENWQKALQVLRQVKEDDRDLVYKYSTVLLVHAAKETVDTWVVIGKEMEATKLIPALLNYSQTVRPGKVANDQAVRYLKNVVTKQGSKEPIVHNTLISLLSMSPQEEETELLAYLQECSSMAQLPYDVDFALRTCIRCHRFESCVHIYCNIHMYHEAVKLALSHGRLELAIKVVEMTRDLDEADAAYTPDLCKNLWFAIVKHVIDNSNEIPLSQVVSLLKQSHVLKIEDVLSLFPDFVVVDDFKQAICDSLESYNTNLVNIQREMKDSITTADKIRDEIMHTQEKRYVIVEPGESCALSGYPLLSKKFYVFPCQHAIRADALTEAVVKNASYKLKKRISELQSRGVASKKELEEVLDDVISEKCFICSDIKVDLIENSLLPIGKSQWDL